MEKYQSYKLEPELWISEIPFHWKKSRVGRHFKIERGRVISKEEIQENLGEYPVYSSQTTNNGELGKISTYDFDGEYVTWTTDGEKTGTCFYRNGKFNTTNVCGMLSMRETTPYSLIFLNYYLNQVTRPYVRLDINPKLMNNMMSEIPLIIPPLHEQQQIVQFLDEKTELIDKLISTKERKIKLLKEQRTSIINQIVTKGLNPKEKMKDSGVDWIGEIPEHWITKKMKFLVQICNGSDFKDFTLEEGGFPVYGSGGEFSRSSKFIYDKISVLLGRKGSIDKPKIVDEPFWCSDTTYYTKIKNGVNPYFFYYLVQQINFERYVYGSTIPSMTKSVYDEMVFPYPLINEQNQIVDFLDSKTKEIDDLVQLEQKKIDLLKEYRQSLISEVVTGKINVSNKN